MVFQGNLDDALQVVILEFVVGNVTLVKEYFRHLFLEVRCRNFNNPVVGLDGIPYSGKVIRYWICIH